MTRLRPTTTAPGLARHFVRAALEAAEVEIVLIETVELLTTELVTNVVIHTRSASDLVVKADDQGVRVEVSDDDPQLPVVGALEPAATSGRGLFILDALADEWGIDRAADHTKTIWFELHGAQLRP